MHWGRTAAGPRFTEELARAMAQSSSHDVLLAISENSTLRETTTALGLPVATVPTIDANKAATLSPLRWWRNRSKLRKLITDNNISSIVLTMEAVWHLAALSPKPPAPVVLILHDVELHAGMNSLAARVSHAEHIRLASAIVVLSENSLAAARRLGLETSQRPVILGHHPVFSGPAESVATVRSAPKSDVRVGFFGRLVEYKGIDLFLDMAEALERQGNYLFSIVGSGEISSSDMARIEDGDHLLDQRYIAESDLPTLLDSFDILVLPYRKASQSGIVGLAAARGLPMVCTPVGGLSDQIREAGGIVAEAADGESLATAVRAIMAPDAYVRSSTRALQYVADAPSWSDLARLVDDAIALSREN